jgi:hypothetical protein
MNLTGCTQEEAENALRECSNDPVDAVDKLLKIPVSKWAPKKKELDETQKHFSEMRKTMEAMDKRVESEFKHSDQPDYSSSPASSHSLVRLPEEPWSDSHHTQQSQILIPELEEQTPGTACQ